MATIMQVDQPGNETREIVCTSMEEWWMTSKYESNSVVVDKEPTFKAGVMIEIASREHGQAVSLHRIVKGIEEDAEKKWIITFNAKGEKRKKVSIITIRLNEEEAQQLEAFKKMVGKKNGSEALKFIMKELPRWNEVMKENLEKCREQEVKYNKLLEVSTNFMLAFQEMVKAVNEGNASS